MSKIVGFSGTSCQNRNWWEISPTGTQAKTEWSKASASYNVLLMSVSSCSSDTWAMITNVKVHHLYTTHHQFEMTSWALTTNVRGTQTISIQEHTDQITNTTRALTWPLHSAGCAMQLQILDPCTLTTALYAVYCTLHNPTCCTVYST